MGFSALLRGPGSGWWFSVVILGVFDRGRGGSVLQRGFAGCDGGGCAGWRARGCPGPGKRSLEGPWLMGLWLGRFGLCLSVALWLWVTGASEAIEGCTGEFWRWRSRGVVQCALGTGESDFVSW